MHTLIKLRKNKSGSVTITGLSEGDCRLIANAIEEGSYHAGDRGQDLSKALLRLAHAFRVPTMFDHQIGHVEIIGRTPDKTVLYEEPVNLSGREEYF